MTQRGRSLALGTGVIACLWGILLTNLADAQEVPPPGATRSSEAVAVLAPRTTVEIAERFAKTLEFKGKVTLIDGHDPSVVTIDVPDDYHHVRVLALQQGVTTAVVHDEFGNAFRIDIFVTGDARLLQAVLQRTFPETSVNAIKVKESVLLRGWVTEPQQITQITELAELYFPKVLNQMRVAGPQQVQIQAKVMEVQRSKARKMGTNFGYSGRNFGLASTPGVITPLSAITTPFGGPATTSLAASGLRNANMAFGVVTNDVAFQGLIEALKEEGLLKIESEPVLVARNGQPAKIRNGGEQPIPVPQGLGTVGIEWRPFGVKLESVPTILSPTRLQLQIIVEVSERDTTNAVTISGTTIPAFTSRGEETTVELDFGQTLVIGGMISTRKTTQTQKVPVLGEIPWFGALFRRTNNTEVETEMVVLMTPEYSSPMNSDQIPPGGPGAFSDTLTDRELFLDGAVEVPNYSGRRNENCPPNVRSASGFAPGGFAPGPVLAPSNEPTSMPSSGEMLIAPPSAPSEGSNSRPQNEFFGDEVSQRGSSSSMWPKVKPASATVTSKKPAARTAGYQQKSTRSDDASNETGGLIRPKAR